MFHFEEKSVIYCSSYTEFRDAYVGNALFSECTPHEQRILRGANLAANVGRSLLAERGNGEKYFLTNKEAVFMECLIADRKADPYLLGVIPVDTRPLSDHNWYDWSFRVSPR